MQTDRLPKFIPALRFNWATKFYDPLVRWTTREYPFKRALIKQADLAIDQTILDLACGTGTLSIGIKRRFPQIAVFAVDADENILRKAKKKALERHISINFQKSFSDSLPFENAKFDRVFSTLFFHHLTTEQKIKTLDEIKRVLKPGGEFHLADFGLPENKTQFILSKFVRLIDGFDSTFDNLNGNLEYLVKNCGFMDVEKTIYFKTILGTIRLFRAVR